ncbi:MAG: hypothetical protein GTO14_15700 [Anaerolineales bacterium]|nr:hypothetical protein [Anaerolineales bacterium]
MSLIIQDRSADLGRIDGQEKIGEYLTIAIMMDLSAEVGRNGVPGKTGESQRS